MDPVAFKNRYTDLLRQWRFTALERWADSVERESGTFSLSRYALFESALAQAKFDQAERIYQLFGSSIDPSTELYTSFLLKYKLLQLQTYQNGDFFNGLDFFEALSCSSQYSAYNRSLASLQRAKALLLGISFGLVAAIEKKNACNFFRIAADGFLAAGAMLEYRTTLITFADACFRKPMPDKEGALAILGELFLATRNGADPLSHAGALLLEAEIQFERGFQPGLDQEALAALTARFEAAIKAYKAAGHLVPQSVVYRRLGSVLLKYGLEQGLTCLDDAIAAYSENGFYAELQAIYREKAHWFLIHGQAEENSSAEKEAGLLDTKTGITLGNKVTFLAQIEQAHRSGNIGVARAIVSKAGKDFARHPLYNQLLSLHANNLSRIGLTEESIPVFREIVERAKPLEISGFLSDAYTNLAANLFRTNPDEAAMYIAKAIQIDEALGDKMTRVQHILLFLQIIIFQQQVKFGLPLVESEAMQLCLQECFLALTDDFTIEATIRLGDTLQAKALVHFMAQRYDEAIREYEEAARVLEGPGLFNQLSFLYAHHGIALIGKARESKMIALYDQAKMILLKGLELFKKGAQKTEQARMLGLAGICDYEAGRLVTDSVSGTERWNNAESYFEQAYVINRYLRINADYSNELSRQRSMIAFGKDVLTYPTQALYMHLQQSQDYFKALKWLERTKAQALVESIKARASESLPDAKAAFSVMEVQDEKVEIVALVKDLLDETTLIMQYFCTASHLFVFGIRKNWSDTKLKTIQLDYEELRQCAEQHFSKDYGGVRDMIDFGMESQWQKFNSIITAMEEWSIPGDQVCLIPHGILHQLPLHTLTTKDGKYAIERNPIFYSQSLSLLAYSSGDAVSADNGLYTVFGDSRNNLPFARNEALAVAAELHTSAGLGDQVTKKSVLGALPQSSIFHISGHSELSDTDGWQYALQLAGTELLSSAEIFTLRMRANLVVLSGCETGVNKYTEGDELSGLARAFMHAGTKNLVVSQWKVDDAATTRLFRTFYTGYAADSGKSVVKRLQVAMCSMIEEGYSFYFWGAFQIFGKL